MGSLTIDSNDNEERKISEERAAAYAAYYAVVERARHMIEDAGKTLDNLLVVLNERATHLGITENNLIVLIRKPNTGPKPTVYHNMEKPCSRVIGQGHDVDRFDRRLENEVRFDLKRCSACLWP